MSSGVESEGVESLVVLALSRAIADSMSRKRRRQLIAELLLIAKDWERDNNVLPLIPQPQTVGGGPALRAAAMRLRLTAHMLEDD